MNSFLPERADTGRWKGAHVKQKLPTRRMREHPDLEQPTRLAKELLGDFAAGANPNAPVDAGGSAVYTAFSHKRWELVELLSSREGLVSAATRGVGVENGTRYNCRNARTA